MAAPTDYRWLAALPESMARTLKLIALYVSENGGRSCFTYRGLRRLWSVKRMYDLEWHTVERNVRRLAEIGLLKRVRQGRTVVFCLTDELAARLRSLGWIS